MRKTGKGQLCGANAAADGLCRLQKQDRLESAAQGDRRRQTIRPGADNYRIVIFSSFGIKILFRLSFQEPQPFLSRYRGMYKEERIAALY